MFNKVTLFNKSDVLSLDIRNSEVLKKLLEPTTSNMFHLNTKQRETFNYDYMIHRGRERNTYFDSTRVQ
jgi:hypothetical protein